MIEVSLILSIGLWPERKEQSLVAYHEVGHAICGTLTPGHDAVQKGQLLERRIAEIE
ncbi:hypothetical protein RYX36_030642 [Vicia faba]